MCEAITDLPQPQAAARQKLHNVQLLRAVAALIVVCIHLKPLFDRLAIPVPSGGVDLFFVISGFIMVTVASGTKPGEFLARRAARIVPLYWALTLFTFGCVLVAPSLFRNTTSDPLDLVKSLLFIPFMKGGAVIPQPVLFVGWTLNYEMFFYLLFAAGLAMGKRGLIFVFAALLGLAAIGLAFKPTGALASFYTSALLLEFALGMTVAVCKWVTSPRWAIALVFITLPLVLYGERLAPGLSRLVSIGVPAAILLAGAVALDKHGLSWSRLSPLGDASYAIYLIHPFITSRTVRSAEYLPFEFTMALIAGAIAVTCVAGWLIYVGFERPATKALNAARWIGARHQCTAA